MMLIKIYSLMKWKYFLYIEDNHFVNEQIFLYIMKISFLKNVNNLIVIMLILIVKYVLKNVI